MKGFVLKSLRPMLLGTLFVLPAILLEAGPESHGYYTVIPPLDIRSLDQPAPSFLAPPNQKAGPIASDQIRKAWEQQKIPSAQFGVFPSMQPIFPMLGFLELGNLFHGLDRLFLRYSLIQFQDFRLGGLLWQPNTNIYSHIALGYGLGTKRLPSGSETHYPVTMLFGLTSRYAEKNGLSSREFAETKDHLLYFTPGMEFTGRTLSIEASLELPIARITPENESLYSRQVRANIGMKYRLK